MKELSKDSNFKQLYADICHVLSTARGKAYSAVNFAMVQSYWQIGKLITDEELGGKQRADYGRYLMKELSERLTQDFGKGFDERELRKICQFYRCFPIRDTLRPELVTLSPTYIRGECRCPDMVYERSGGKHVVDPSA